MNKKMIGLLICILLITTSIPIVSSMEKNIEQNNHNEYTRKVFVEQSTSTTSKYCTNVAEVLNNLFDPENPEFYYISLVEDENDLAYDRVVNHYNRRANPTVFMDGGYEVIFGFRENFEEDFNQKVQDSLLREAPELIVEVNAGWNESRTELTTRVNIENKDLKTYTGELKVFICEIKSTRWKDYNGDAFSYAFLEYAIEQDIIVNPGENKEFSSIWNASLSKYSEVFPENLMIYAVIYNSESTEKYSDPPPLGHNNNPFDAYYADVVEASRVQEGTLPPTIGIISPKNGYRYYFNLFNRIPLIRSTFGYFISQLRNGNTPLVDKFTLIGDTVIFGRGKIGVTVDAPAGIEIIEFYVDGELMHINTNKEPYHWRFSKIDNRNLIKKHNILVKVIDSQGRSAEDSIDIVTIFI